MELLGIWDYIFIFLVILALLAFFVGFIRASGGAGGELFAFLVVIMGALTYMLYKDLIPTKIIQTLAMGIIALAALMILLNGDYLSGLTLPFPFLVILGIVVYINFIPPGVYQARFTEIKGKKIIKGAKGSEPYEFGIDKQSVNINDGPYIPFDKNASNFYINIYSLNGQSISVTKMGTVKVRDKNGFEASMDVDY